MLLDRNAALAVLGDLDWFNIEAAQFALDAAEVWSEDWLVGAIDRAKRHEIRDILRGAKGEADLPAFGNVENEEGERVYKAERLFNVDDYVQVIDHHNGKAAHHSLLAGRWRDRGVQRFGDQLRFKLSEGAA